MSRKLYLRPLSPCNNRIVNMLPFSDWLANVDRRIERRTGERNASNNLPNSYWEQMYHLGDSFQDAADYYIENPS